MRIHNDRGAVAAAAVIQIISDGLRDRLHDDHADMALVRAAVEQYLRDDYADQAQQGNSRSGRPRGCVMR